MVWWPLLSADSMETSQTGTAKHPPETQLTDGGGNLGELRELATFLVDPKMATLPFDHETYTYS